MKPGEGSVESTRGGGGVERKWGFINRKGEESDAFVCRHDPLVVRFFKDKGRERGDPRFL